LAFKCGNKSFTADKRTDENTEKPQKENRNDSKFYLQGDPSWCPVRNLHVLFYCTKAVIPACFERESRINETLDTR